MFLTFLFRSAPEEGLYCKPKYRAKKFVFLKNKYISVILAFVVCSLKLVTSAVGISLPLIFSNAQNNGDQVRGHVSSMNIILVFQSRTEQQS